MHDRKSPYRRFMRSACGDDDRFDAVAGVSELRFDAGARRGAAGRKPGVPHGVHCGVVGHFAQVERDQQQAALVAAGGKQQALDAGQHLVRLRRDVGGERLRDFDEIDGVAVGDGIRVALRAAVPFDVHGVVLCKK